MPRSRLNISWIGERSGRCWIDFEAKKSVRRSGDGHHGLIMTCLSGRELHFPSAARLDQLAHRLLD